MFDIFDKLIISAPNMNLGGIFFVQGRAVFRLDSRDTTGLSFGGERLARGIQPNIMQLYGMSSNVLHGKDAAFHDIHDILYFGGNLYVVGTAGNVILKLSLDGHEVQRWVFPGEPDSWHINCLGAWGERVIFSAFGDFRVNRGYKGVSRGSGFVQDLLTGQRLIEGLSQPHSLVTLDDNLLVANSELGEIIEFSPTGDVLRTARFNGYTRGICVAGDNIYVGLSCTRNVEIRGIEEAVVVALDRRTFGEKGRLPIPTKEIFSIIQIKDADALALTLASICAASSEAHARTVAADAEEAASLSRTVADQDAENARLQARIAAHDAEAAELQGRIAAQEAEAAELQGRIAAQEAEAAELQGRIAAQEAEAAELQGRIAAQEAEAAELQGRIAAQEAAITTARQESGGLIDRLRMTQERIAALEHSLSWRITAPLRLVLDVLCLLYDLCSSRSLRQQLGVSLWLLPSALVYYRGLLGFLAAYRRGEGLFTRVITGQSEVHDKLVGRNRLLRSIVSLSFAFGCSMLRSGSVWQTIRNILTIYRAEGVAGLKRNAERAAPGYTPSVLVFAQEDTASPSCAGTRILVADYRVPRSDTSAGERATVGIVSDLCSLGYEVVFLSNSMDVSPKYEAELRQLGAEVITHGVGYHSSAQYLEERGAGFDVFYLIRVDVAETLLAVARRVAPQARVLFHAPDLYFLRETRQAELANDPAAFALAHCTRDRELAMMGSSDHVVVVSPVEQMILRDLLPQTPVSVFPVLYANVVVRPVPYAQRKHIFFLGGFGHTPNVSAVQWFATAVWPHVREALPDAEFHIVGAEAPASVRGLGDLPGIRVVGFVPDLDPLLQTLRVCVAPLLFGAGIKGKVAAAMGAGIPCVCTEIAAEGMGIRNNEHALVENDPQRFAQAVVSLYSNEALWTRLARNGRALVEAKFGDAANRASLLKVLDRARALPLPMFCAYCQAAAPGSVPEFESVDVSIIVPVYNKWPLTKACLTSVIRTSAGSGVSYEIILADDGSTDETIHAAEQFPGLLIAKTPSNLGFLRNCNNAAKHARGRHLVLLNNDTIVLPGWLEALYARMESNPMIAIVGSKLLYPDGLIQEAGACIMRDGTGYNAGRGLSRHRAEFAYAREVDYVSGASVMVRKAFWDAVGGFDETFKNAYCEDSDLAMQARQHGMMVVYEPLSEVVHFEHGSYGDEIASVGNKALQAHNTKILIKKWHKVLHSGEHLLQTNPDMTISHAERRRVVDCQVVAPKASFTVLYFSPFPSHPVCHGNRATMVQFGNQLKRLGFRVHFVVLCTHDVTAEGLRQMEEFWDAVEVIPFHNPMLPADEAIPYDGWYEAGLGERIKCICHEQEVKAVICSYVFQSKLLEFVPRHILKILDTHDKMGNRYEMLRSKGVTVEFFSCSEQEEGEYLHRADIIVARRKEEADYFNAVMGTNRSIVVPHFEAPQYAQRYFGAVQSIGIVASANLINVAMLQECLEAIDKAFGSATVPFTVNIAGQVKDIIQRLPRQEVDVFSRPWVRLLGFVPDIADFYASVDLVLSPVTLGTGINVKTVQALAFGMPLLTTECGSKGTGTKEPMHRHKSLEALAASLAMVVQEPDAVNRLAWVSREVYDSFHADCEHSFESLFTWPHKQIRPDAFLPRTMHGMRELPPEAVFTARRAHEAKLQRHTLGDGESSAVLRYCRLCGVSKMTYRLTKGDAASGAPAWVNWREELVCSGCSLNSRLRASIHLVLDIVRLSEHAKVYLTEQTTLLYKKLKKAGFFEVVGSEYLGDRCALGSEIDSLRNEDLTRLTFPDDSFDAVLCFDVLEHIPNYADALREVFRVLAPGGHFICSVPFDKGSATTLHRAVMRQDGGIDYILTPEYHGDPLDADKGVLCFQTFGWEIMDGLKAVGFARAAVYDCWNDGYGYLGDILLLVAAKPEE